jgi:AAA+ ATPase superfamily predicted ATPase
MTEAFETRNKEETEILGYLKNSINTFVYGPQGIGKTTLIRSIDQGLSGRKSRTFTAF